MNSNNSNNINNSDSNKKYLSGNSTNTSSKNIQKLSKITTQSNIQGISLENNPFYGESNINSKMKKPLNSYNKIKKNLF